MYTVLLDSSSTLGLDFINDHMISLATYMGKFATAHSNSFTNLARVLGVIFAMIAIAMQLYKSMGRGEGINILSIARPFLFAIVLAFWPSVCKTVTAPGQIMEDAFREIYKVEKSRVYQLREERYQVSTRLADEIRLRRAAAEQAQEAVGKNEGVLSQMYDVLADTANYIAETFEGWILIFENWTMKWLESGLMWIGELFWQCGIYYTFLSKNVFLCVLCMFGPIFMAASILPTWETKWADWIGRTISVSFYGVMAYIVMIFSMQLMVYTIQADINVMNDMVDDIAVMNYSGNAFGSTCLTVTAMFVGYKALVTMVPELASWVFPSTSVHAANNFISGATGSSYGAAKWTGKQIVK